VTRTAIVTGAAGFIGSCLVDRLLADGWVVIGVDSFEDYYPREYKEHNIRAARLSDRFFLLETSLLALAETDGHALGLRGALEQADVVFHLAAQAGVRASWGRSFNVYTDNNILSTQLLLEACRIANVSRLRIVLFSVWRHHRLADA
jgi:nucleoside-diphosphate-sugar epimerase